MFLRTGSKKSFPNGLWSGLLSTCIPPLSFHGETRHISIHGSSSRPPHLPQQSSNGGGTRRGSIGKGMCTLRLVKGHNPLLLEFLPDEHQE